MSKHRIAYMADPPIEDRQSAIIVAVHTAREYLSFAERAADSATLYYPEVLAKIRSADDLLGTATAICHEVAPDQTARARSLLVRAREAAKAAFHQGELARSYFDAGATEPAFDAKQAKKTRGILRRAAEAARQETHRALAELAETFPDAYDVEDDEEPGGCDGDRPDDEEAGLDDDN